jgi:hypothetical protein
MSLSKSIFVGVIVCLALPLMAVAQSTNPAAVGATPAGPNFDPWPNYIPVDNSGWNFDVGALGADSQTGRQEFILFGQSNDGNCGPKTVIVSTNGIEVPLRDAFLDDNGNQFWGAASIATYGDTGGFGYRADVGTDPTTGQYLISTTFFNNDFNGGLGYVFSAPVSYFTYARNSATDPCIHNHFVAQRFDRNMGKVSNMTPGRNIPSTTSHTLDPYWPLGNPDNGGNGHTGHGAGVAILSNGNSLYYLRDGTNVNSKGAVDYYREMGLVPGFGLATGRHNCQLHSVTDPSANTFVVSTTPTFVTSNGDSTDLGDHQLAAAGNGWFAMRAPAFNGCIAFFRNDGTRIKQIFGYKDLYEATAGLLPGVDDTINVGDGRNFIAASDDILYVCTRYLVAGAEPQLPCVLRFQVNAARTNVTLLPAILPASDLPAEQLGVNISPRNLHVACNKQGDFVVGFRKNPSESNGPGAPIARVYKNDGTPVTSSFYLSSLADPTSDNAMNYGENADLKVALNGNLICAAWFTETGINADDEVECSGNTKSAGVAGINMDTAVRFFEVEGIGQTSVGNWDLY